MGQGEALGTQDCFLLLCGHRNLGGPEEAGMLATSWSIWLFHCCPGNVELSRVLGPGKVLFDVNPPYWFPGTNKNPFLISCMYLEYAAC